MLFGIIILAVAVFVAYMLNKSKVSEVKIEAPEKIEPAVEQPAKAEKAAPKAKTAKKTAVKKSK